jgi:hypothetical protein
MGRWSRRALVLTFSLVAWPARADTDSNAAARAQRLFDDGRALMEQGRYAEACAKFSASDRESPSGGSLLNLADCYEKAGKTASAWARFKEVAARADAANRSDIAEHARQRALALAPQLATLTVEVPDTSRSDGLAVKRDDEPVAQAVWNTALPIDPGTYAVEASAPHRTSWRTLVVIPASASAMRVVVPRLVPDVVEGPPPAQPAAADLPAARKIALVTGAGGLVAIGVASFFGLRAKSKNDEAREHCPASPACVDAEGPALTDSARSAATASTVLFVGGGVLVASALVLWFTAPSSRPGAAAARAMRAGVFEGAF